jgi:hypothetical protein
MRRRWNLLVAVGAVALLAGLLFLLPPRDDGFDWIRKYGLRRQELRINEPGANGAPGETRAFLFNEAHPGFEGELRRRLVWSSKAKDNPWVIGMLPGGWHVSYRRNSDQVNFFRFKTPNWFEIQLSKMKRTFGFK